MCIISGLIAGLSAIGGALASAATSTAAAVAIPVAGAAIGGITSFMGYQQQVAAAEAQEAQYQAGLENARRQRDLEIQQQRDRYGEQQRELRVQSFQQQRAAIQERARIGAALSGLGQAGTSFQRVETQQQVSEDVQRGQLETQRERLSTDFALGAISADARYADTVNRLPRGVAPSATAGLLGAAGGLFGGLGQGVGVVRSLQGLR